jgi:hypothetical protein
MNYLTVVIIAGKKLKGGLDTHPKMMARTLVRESFSPGSIGVLRD